MVWEIFAELPSPLSFVKTGDEEEEEEEEEEEGVESEAGGVDGLARRVAVRLGLLPSTPGRSGRKREYNCARVA
jgi:hypothetical protein